MIIIVHCINFYIYFCILRITFYCIFLSYEQIKIVIVIRLLLLQKVILQLEQNYRSIPNVSDPLVISEAKKPSDNKVSLI